MVILRGLLVSWMQKLISVVTDDLISIIELLCAITQWALSVEEDCLLEQSTMTATTDRVVLIAQSACLSGQQLPIDRNSVIVSWHVNNSSANVESTKWAWMVLYNLYIQHNYYRDTSLVEWCYWHSVYWWNVIHWLDPCVTSMLLQSPSGPIHFVHCTPWDVCVEEFELRARDEFTRTHCYMAP